MGLVFHLPMMDRVIQLTCVIIDVVDSLSGFKHVLSVRLWLMSIRPGDYATYRFEVSVSCIQNFLSDIDTRSVSGS